MANKQEWIKGGEIDPSVLKKEAAACIKLIQSISVKKQKEGADSLYRLIVLTWSLETKLARDAADIVCDYVRVTGGLESLLSLCQSTTSEPAPEMKSLQLSVLRVIEQIMVAENRQYIAEHKLFPSLLLLSSSSQTLDHVRCGTGILENLFKVSRRFSLKLVQSSGLDIVVFGCRYTDDLVLQHCAAAMANCALYGCEQVHKAMIAKHADHWLFPLAFSPDSAVKYYALIAICILASNAALTSLVYRSGALELVLPFLQLQDPNEFPRTCPNHAHGRTLSWLERLVPLLQCKSEEAQSLAAFHFAMEAGIKKEQSRLNIFSELKVEVPLQSAAREGSELTSRFACQALRTMGSQLPPYRYWDVLNWTPDQVSQWIDQIGLPEFSNKFKVSLVTGNILIDITKADLYSLGYENTLIQKWLLERIKELRCRADFSTKDPEHICQWLISVGPELAIYKPDFMRSGVTREILPLITHETLIDLSITSHVHRLKIMLAIEKLALASGHDSPDFETHLRSIHPALRKKYDVFLSYRRSSGSQLASLLKVHLQLRGLNVFLDVTALGSGKFDDALLTTIANSLNMVIVLTAKSLDRCIGDVTTQDWVHRELAHAIDSGVHIVPVMDEFIWPKSELLPSDMRSINTMNGVRWSHEYQEACVDKLVNFLQLPASIRRRGTRHDSISLGISQLN